MLAVSISTLYHCDFSLLVHGERFALSYFDLKRLFMATDNRVFMFDTPLHWQTVYPTDLSFTLPEKTLSLTQVLSHLTADFSVSLQFLGETTCYPCFMDWLGYSDTNWDSKERKMMFAREVALCLNGVAVVHAQSLCLPDSIWKEQLNCGTTPLGALLFSGSLDLVRSPFTFSKPKGYLVARRSWFDWQGERLYLAEGFLEPILAFLAKR